MDVPPQPPPSPQLNSDSGNGKKWLFGCGGGCLFAVVALMLCAVLVVNWVKGIPGRYTDSEPITIEAEEVSPAEISSATDKFNTFRDDIANGRPTAPISLNTDEINTLINNHPDLAEMAGKTKVEIADDTIGADVSVPLDNIHELVDGRYLNGRIFLRISYENENLNLVFDSIEVNGNPLPDFIMQEFRNGIDQQELEADAEIEEMKKVIESITIKDGVLTVVPKNKAP